MCGPNFCAAKLTHDLRKIKREEGRSKREEVRSKK
jgi:hypothetical protein